ncbi:CASP-like protein 4D1 [Carica papaya]|uniref:CASP-like protein 4D1 n=1 Tax=Carica papaya TaxID=3649 RepID=UPI000B8C7BEC|nr:CASP-like protein 4D1 [Carica papaya]
MLAAVVIGLAYTILQVGFTLCHFSTGNHVIGGQGHLLFDFYGDKFISYVLATGAAAGFGVSKDLKDTVKIIFPESSSNIDKFFSKAHASCSLLLIAFVFTAVLSTLSSYALPKRVNN